MIHRVHKWVEMKYYESTAYILFSGGRLGSVRYSIMFTIAGTAIDYATLKLKPVFRSYKETILEESNSWMKLPEWSPIQVLDEEALAAKQAREQQLYAQRVLGQVNKKDP